MKRREDGTTEELSSFTTLEERIMFEAVEKIRTRRTTIRMSEDNVSYTRDPNSTIHFKEEYGGVSCIRWSPEGKEVAVGFYSGELKMCLPKRLNARAGVRTILRGWEGGHNITCVRFHPSNPELLYASSHDGTVAACQAYPADDNPHPPDLVINEFGNEINSFDFDMKGSTVVTVGKDATIRVYDSKTNKLVRAYSRSESSASSTTLASKCSQDSHEQRIYCVKCHPDQHKIFITGGWDRAIKMWDMRLKEFCVHSFVGPFIWGETVDIHRGAILTGSCVARESLHLWDLTSFGDPLGKVVPTNKPVYLYGEYPYTAQFYKGDPSGDLILCGGTGLGGLQVISVQESKIKYLIEDPKPIVAADSTDGKIAFGGKSHCVSFVNLKEEEVASQSFNTMELGENEEAGTEAEPGFDVEKHSGNEK